MGSGKIDHPDQNGQGDLVKPKKSCSTQLMFQNVFNEYAITKDERYPLGDNDLVGVLMSRRVKLAQNTPKCRRVCHQGYAPEKHERWFSTASTSSMNSHDVQDQESTAPTVRTAPVKSQHP